MNIILLVTGNFITETIYGTTGLIGDLGTLLGICGIMIGIVRIGERLGFTINLRQGSYHDIKFHKQNQEQE